MTTPKALAKDTLVIQVPADKYDWVHQRRETHGKEGWIAATDKTGTETATGTWLDTDSDNDDSY